jgi:ubiquinone/menaquinone biosynthesis C-methylase UbiE
MNEIKLVSKLHTSTKRDYLTRVTNIDKAWAAQKAVKWGLDYWDGSRDTGYGGYKYDGRWREVADGLISFYELRDGAKILDVGSGKGFLLHDLKEANPSFEVAGIDISEYGIENSMPTIRDNCILGTAANLPWKDNYFDLVISINTLHNLGARDLHLALSELQRVSKIHKYVCVESFRDEQEKVNLLYWQLTCRAFHTPADWDFIFQQSSYNGDYEFIFFE